MSRSRAVTDDGVLVRIRAAATNPYDWHFMRAKPLFTRLMFGLFRPKDHRLGADLAGEVEAVGKDVTRFRVGDAVFGEGVGAFAEYTCVPERWLAKKPASLTFEQAAAVPMAGGTALQGLRDGGKIQAGQKVLIHGASGGVGTFAVQIAKSFGAEVTGVCSTKNVEMVKLDRRRPCRRLHARRLHARRRPLRPHAGHDREPVAARVPARARSEGRLRLHRRADEPSGGLDARRARS